MKRLIYFSMNDEVLAAASFLNWQQCGVPPILEQSQEECLRIGGGVPCIVLCDGPVPLAVGFFGIIKFWQDNGLCLL